MVDERLRKRFPGVFECKFCFIYIEEKPSESHSSICETTHIYTAEIEDSVSRLRDYLERNKYTDIRFHYGLEKVVATFCCDVEKSEEELNGIWQDFMENMKSKFKVRNIAIERTNTYNNIREE